MAFPSPVPGQVIRYSYLWNAEHLQGQDEGVKDRPCAVVMVSEAADAGTVVTVLPITHTPPSLSQRPFALEIPPKTKRRLGLDSERSWVILSEANRFVWPGPDLRMADTGDPASIVYGLLPERFFEHLRVAFIVAVRASQVPLVPRSE